MEKNKGIFGKKIGGAFLLGGLLSLSLIGCSTGTGAKIKRANNTETSFIYGYEKISEENDLHLILNDTASTYVWKKASEPHGTYTVLAGQDKKELILKPSSEDAEAWYTCNDSEPIRVMKVSEGDDYQSIGGRTTVHLTQFTWFLGDESDEHAYCVRYDGNDVFFDVASKYVVPQSIKPTDPNYSSEFEGHDVWIFPSYSEEGFSVKTSEDSNPDSITRAESSSVETIIESIVPHIVEDGVDFSVTLGENQKALSVGIDTKVADAELVKPLLGDTFDVDKAPVYANLNEDLSLNYISIVGAPVGTSDEITKDLPSFIFTPKSKVDLMYINEYIQSRLPRTGSSHKYRFFCTNYEGDESEGARYQYGAFNEPNNLAVIGMENGDSVMSTSWINHQPGDVIEFNINAGSRGSISSLNTPVEKVESLIDDIGTLSYTPETKAKIDAAKTAYEALTDEEKEAVDNYDELKSADETYKKIENIVSLVDQNTDSSKKSAKEAYDALSDEEKVLVPQETVNAINSATPDTPTPVTPTPDTPTPDTPDTPPVDGKDNHGFCLGWISFILMVLQVLFFGLYLLVRLNVLKQESLKEKVSLLNGIALVTSEAFFIFALVAMCIHPCVMSIIGLSVITLIRYLNIFDFIKVHNLLKKK